MSAVVKELMISPTESRKIEEDVRALAELSKKKSEDPKLTDLLKAIKEECDKGIQNRVAVGKLITFLKGSILWLASNFMTCNFKIW